MLYDPRAVLQRTFLALLVQCVEQGLWNCWASVSPSVCLSHLATTAAVVSLLLWAWRAGDIDWLLHGWRATAAASSVVLLADVDLLNLLFYSVCAPPMQAPGHNAPLIWFLISVLYTLFACLCRMFPHLSFFSSLFITFLLPYLSPPLLIFSFENRSAPLSGRMLLKATKPGFSFFCVYLEQGADLHMAQLMPLPLTLSCFCKILIGFAFLVPAYLGCPGKRVVKHVCVFVLYISFDWWMRAFVVLRLVFSIPSQEIGLGKRLRNTYLGSSGT